MFSRALIVGSRLNDWKMKPMRRRRSRVSALSLREVASTWPMTTRPSVGVSSPAAQCMSVDLPEPEGPMMAVNWPRRKSTVTWSSATTRVSPCP